MMCRGNKTCSELGTDASRWDRYAPLRRPGWIHEQWVLFEVAVQDFFAGKQEACLMQLQQINSEAIIHWYIEHGQMAGRHRRLHLNKVIPGIIAMEFRDPVRSPKKLQEQVFIRDGYRCRYCGSKLLSQEFIRLFVKKLQSPLFQRGSTNISTHGIIHLGWPVADHVIPWNQGGRTDMSNLVASCAPCNYGKDGNTVEQIGIENPFDRAPVTGAWNGFADKTALLKSG